MLEEREYPYCVGYLRGWVSELHGRSGVGQFGLAPLSYATIESWSRLKGVRVKPHEVDALIALDGFMLNPGKEEE